MQFLTYVTAQVRMDGTYITVSQSEPGYSTADKAFKQMLIAEGLLEGEPELTSVQDREFAERMFNWAREVMVARSSFQEKQRTAVLEGVNKVNYRILAALYTSFDRIVNRKKAFGAPGDVISCRAMLKGMRAQRLESRLEKGLDATFESLDSGSRITVELPSNLQQDAVNELVLDDEYQATFYVISAQDLTGGWYCRGSVVDLMHITNEGAVRVIGGRIAIPARQRAMPVNALGAPPPEPQKVRDISLTEDD